jgi:hypothetical protein
MNLRRTVKICDVFICTKSSWVSSILGGCVRNGGTQARVALTARVGQTVDLAQMQMLS